MIVYQITNTVNGKSYIGITTKSIEHRWAAHINASKKESCANRPLYLAFKKYGANSFRMEQLCAAETLEELCELEMRYIAERGTFSPNGYNVTHGGEGPAGYRHTEATKKIMSSKAIGRSFSAETRAKLSIKAKGRKIPREAIERARMKRIGAIRAEEQRARISAGRIGKGLCNQGSRKYPIELVMMARDQLRDGIKQADVARATGLSQSYVCNLATGRRGRFKGE